MNPVVLFEIKKITVVPMMHYLLCYGTFGLLGLPNGLQDLWHHQEKWMIWVKDSKMLKMVYWQLKDCKIIFAKICTISFLTFSHMAIKVLVLWNLLLKYEQINSSSQLQCRNCNFCDNPIGDRLSPVIHSNANIFATVRAQLEGTMITLSRQFCPECLHPLKCHNL